MEEYGNEVPENTLEDAPSNTEINWEQKYTELLALFNKVCNHHNISKCQSCSKYRQCIQCVCGRKNCATCTYPTNTRTVEYVNCSFCNKKLCKHCTAIYCSNGDHYLCGVFDEGCYNCYADCGSIICYEHAPQSLCTHCDKYFCKNCEEGHYPCYPVRCSCGSLVYNAPLSECTICKKTACKNCITIAMKHRAAHSMIPFLIIEYREELPVLLPLEIKIRIWEYLLRE